jgi:hypothetical protein
MGIFKSRTFWTAVLAFAVNTIPQVASQIPAVAQPWVNLGLLAATTYFRANPTQPLGGQVNISDSSVTK